ncbi:MAG: hypothetical protein V3R25_09250 [Nitrosomonadaceae bacterium]
MIETIEINDTSEIDPALIKIDYESTVAVNRGHTLYINMSIEDPQAAYTKKQRGALHVWCRMLAECLNDAGLHMVRQMVFSDKEVEIDWTDLLVKEFIYKPMLQSMTGKQSTEDQSTVNPSDVSQTITRHFAGKGIVCPAWPSNKNMG